MFEYQTTGTHLISYFALRFCLLMPEKSCRGSKGPQPVSHSSVGGGLVFGAVVVTGQVHVI